MFFVILRLMKKMLIVEGIATSGKPSLIKEIISLLGEDKVRVYSESETPYPDNGRCK